MTTFKSPEDISKLPENHPAHNIVKQLIDDLICVQAGMVTAAYIQANDQSNYNKWKAIEKSNCKAAGLP